MRGDRLGLQSLHLWVLTAFAVSQPILEILSQNREFFVVRGFTGPDVAGVAALLVLVVPAAPPEQVGSCCPLIMAQLTPAGQQPLRQTGVNG